MGTRGLIGFIMPDGTVKASYNQSDMYPTGVGQRIGEELIGISALKQLLPDVERIRWVDARDEPTLDDLRHLAELGIKPEEVSTGRDWYAALRSCHGSMRKRIMLGIATDDSNFIKDSLFCEWVYLVDFRSDEMVILEGFNKDLDKQAPYARCEPTADTEYFGCKEVWRASLDAFCGLNMQAFEDSLAEA